MVQEAWRYHHGVCKKETYPAAKSSTRGSAQLKLAKFGIFQFHQNPLTLELERISVFVSFILWPSRTDSARNKDLEYVGTRHKTTGLESLVESKEPV